MKTSTGIAIVLITAVVVVVVLAGVYRYRHNADNDTTNNNTTTEENAVSSNGGSSSTNNTVSSEPPTEVVPEDQNLATAPTLVSSSPAQGAKLEGDQSKATVTFNVALDASATLKVSRRSYDVSSGSTILSSDRKTMEIGFTGNASDDYTINYTACITQNSNCSIGSISFEIEDAATPNTREPAAPLPQE